MAALSLITDLAMGKPTETAIRAGIVSWFGDGGQKRGPGRPALDPAIQTLILHMAKGNPKWGCVRVRGELLRLGYRSAGDVDS